MALRLLSSAGPSISSPSLAPAGDRASSPRQLSLSPARRFWSRRMRSTSCSAFCRVSMASVSASCAARARAGPCPARGERLGAGVHLVGVALLLRALRLDAPELPGDLRKALVQLLDGRAHGVQAHGVRLVIRLGRLEALGVARHGDLLLVQLVLRALRRSFSPARRLSIWATAPGRPAPRVTSSSCAASSFISRSRPSRFCAFCWMLPPVMLPPECITSPSSVTSRKACPPARMMAMPLSRSLATTVRPSRLSTTPRYRVIAAQLAGHADAAGHGEHLALARGEGAAPHGAQRQKRGAAQPVFAQVVDQDLASCSVSVTMFCIAPPSAMSMAVSYSRGTCKSIATTSCTPFRPLRRA